MELGRFDNYDSMKRASERFVMAMTGKLPPKDTEAENQDQCAHDSRYSFVWNGKRRCRQCNPRTAAELSRERRLPEMIENTRTKLAHLEAEAKRRGLIT